MAIRNYVGARYVPKFANPVEWQANTSYEAMVIVTYNNSSYTSKIPVPPTIGNPAENSTYWALTGNYNAQVEQYRQETETVSNNLTTEITNRENADTTLQSQINQILMPGSLGFVSFKMFGAVGDGVTNDYQAIKDCCAFAETNKKSIINTDGIYYVNGDTINLNASMYNTDNVTFILGEKYIGYTPLFEFTHDNARDVKNVKLSEVFESRYKLREIGRASCRERV